MDLIYFVERDVMIFAFISIFTGAGYVTYCDWDMVPDAGISVMAMTLVPL
jgi:hypothetical protein